MPLGISTPQPTVLSQACQFTVEPEKLLVLVTVLVSTPPLELPAAEAPASRLTSLLPKLSWISGVSPAFGS